MKSKKIAWLISAYIEPGTLSNLIRALDDPEVDFYIHIDKKFEDLPFRDAVGDRENVFFLEEDKRVRVYWGGYTQITMQYNLINAALNSGTIYETVSYITGTDYPLYSNTNIISTLTDGKARIKGFNISNETATVGNIEKQKDRLIFFNYLDIPFKPIWVLIKKMRIRRIRKYESMNIDFYMGSEYWALPYKCIKEIIHKWDNFPEFRDFLKFVFAPSEIWIHTLFFNSEWKDMGELHPDTVFPGIGDLSPLTYFDYRRSIVVFKEEDIGRIMNSGRLFARKIIVGQSGSLINMIDEKRKE